MRRLRDMAAVLAAAPEFDGVM
ncbi:unnamed protein product, partial [Rotaria sp. Silwood1]